MAHTTKLAPLPVRLTRFAGAAAKAFVFSGGSRGFGSLSASLPGSSIQWDREAGQAWKNSAVAICLAKIIDTFPEAPLVVRRRTKDGKEIVPDHRLAELLRRPNGHYSGALLWSATLISLAVDGNGYWLIERSGETDRPVALHYEPHWNMEPRWDSDQEFISHYDRTTATRGKVPVPAKDVIHFRTGMDPENTRKGMSRLKMVLREVVSDNEAATYTAAILKNMGVPGVILTPKASSGDTPTVSPGFAKRVKEIWNEIVRGDKRGEALAMNDPMDITVPGFSPEQLALDKIRQVPEARICGILGVPALIAGFSVGEGQKTYSNWREAREDFYESTIIPMHCKVADDIDIQLLPQVSPNAAQEEVGWDYSEVRVLQEDRNAQHKRLKDAVGGPYMTANEARQELGMQPVQGGDVLNPVRSALTPGQPGEEDEAPKTAAAKTLRAEWAAKAQARREQAEREAIDA